MSSQEHNWMAHDELPMYCPDCHYHFDICECEETQIAREWIRYAKFRVRMHNFLLAAGFVVLVGAAAYFVLRVM